MKSEIKEMLRALLPVALTLAALALAVFVAYQISVSDLPPWFKFWLLRGG